MSLLETTAALHPAVLTVQRPTLAPGWTSTPRHAAARRTGRPAVGWAELRRLLGRAPRHRAEEATFGFGLFTTVRAQQSLRSQRRAPQLPRPAAAG